MQRLIAAARKPGPSRQLSGVKEHVVRSSEGGLIARGQRAGRGGGITISIPSPARHERAVLLAAFEEILSWVSTRDGKARQEDR